METPKVHVTRTDSDIEDGTISLDTPSKDAMYRTRSLSSLKDFALKKFLGDTEQNFGRRFSRGSRTSENYSNNQLSTISWPTLMERPLRTFWNTQLVINSHNAV